MTILKHTLCTFDKISNTQNHFKLILEKNSFHCKHNCIHSVLSFNIDILCDTIKRSHNDVQQRFPVCFLCSNLCPQNRHRQWESRRNNTADQYFREHVASHVKRLARPTTLRAQQRNIFFSVRDTSRRLSQDAPQPTHFPARRFSIPESVASHRIDEGPQGRAALPRWPPNPSFHVPSTLRVGSHARRTMTRCDRDGEAYFRRDWNFSNSRVSPMTSRPNPWSTIRIQAPRGSGTPISPRMELRNPE